MHSLKAFNIHYRQVMDCFKLSTSAFPCYRTVRRSSIHIALVRNYWLSAAFISLYHDAYHSQTALRMQFLKLEGTLTRKFSSSDMSWRNHNEMWRIKSFFGVSTSYGVSCHPIHQRCLLPFLKDKDKNQISNWTEHVLYYTRMRSHY